MKMHCKIILSLKYLRAHIKRFTFLILAISFGFTIITAMTALSDGVARNVHEAAREHYGGDLFVTGFYRHLNDDAIQLIRDVSEIDEAIEVSGVSPDHIIKRTNSFQNGSILFAGKAVRQKNIFGLNISLSYGSFDTNHQSLVTRFGTEKNGFVLALGRHASENDFRYYDNKGTITDSSDDEWRIRNNSDYDSQNIIAKWNFDITSGHRIMTKFSLTNTKRGVLGLGRRPDRRILHFRDNPVHPRTAQRI